MCADLLEGDEKRPIPVGTNIPAADYDANGALTNGVAVAAAAAAHPNDVTNSAAIADWDKRNKQLYGLLIQALPTWLKTSVYNSHRNDGVAAVVFLRSEFDAISEGDYATQLAALQRSVIDPRADLSDADLRSQYDHIMTACAAMERTNHARPDASLLKAILDNSLPAAYNTIRQLVRRSAHASFSAHYADYMTQVRAELASRAPTPRALQAHGGGSGASAPSDPPPTGSLAVCLNCGEVGHARQNCTKPKAKCSKCGARHKSSFCGNGSERDRLSDGARALVDREAKRQQKGKDTPPRQSYAAAAAATAPPQGGGGPHPITPAQPVAPSQHDPQSLAIAYAAAAQAASAQSDPSTAATTYSATLRSLGYGLMARSSLSSGDSGFAMVDTMATYWIVPSIDYLWRVTNDSPGFGVTTADGVIPALAVGIALVYLQVGQRSECYEVHNVVVLPSCPDILYSTRVMRDSFGFKHELDQESPRILVPGTCDIAVCDDGSTFKIPISFVPRGSSRPRGVHAPRHAPPVARLTGGSAFPAGVAGTSQAVLFHRLGFPHAEQWQHVPSGTTGHGLPPTTTLKGDLPLREAVAKGRSRAASFRPTVTPEPQPAPGAWVYMDFAGPLIPSVVHSYVAFCCTVDPGSAYGRVWPCNH